MIVSLRDQGDQGDLDIAIIGMSGRFPGARHIDEFWRNLRDGVESVSFFTEQELKSFGVNPAVVCQPNFVKAGAPLEDVDLFDASFFGYSPMEASIIDPLNYSAWLKLFDRSTCSACQADLPLIPLSARESV